MTTPRVYTVNDSQVSRPYSYLHEFLPHGTELILLSDHKELIDAQATQISTLQAELAEQCRINGIGSEREARLESKLAEKKMKNKPGHYTLSNESFDALAEDLTKTATQESK